MRRPLLFVLVAAALLGGRASALPKAQARTPVVVELFTAQGCANCPDADRLLEDYAAHRGVVALMLPVDYWDYLGWADTFAKPEFTARQRAYAARLKVREIYTPEVVVDGTREAPGLDRDAVGALIKADAHALAGGPRVELLHGGAKVRVSPGERAVTHADVWLMRFDPQARAVKVKAGDNKGRTVTQRFVVRELIRLGGYSGGARTYAAPKADTPGLSTVVLVQGAHGGRIAGVGQG